MLSRRSMLAGMLFAPAVVKAEILMPVKRLVVPDFQDDVLDYLGGPQPWEAGSSYIAERMRELEIFYNTRAFIPYSKDVVPFSPEAHRALQDA